MQNTVVYIVHRVVDSLIFFIVIIEYDVDIKKVGFQKAVSSLCHTLFVSAVSVGLVNVVGIQRIFVA